MKLADIRYCVDCGHFDMRITESGRGVCRKDARPVLRMPYVNYSCDQHEFCCGNALDARFQLLDLIEAAR